MSLVAVATSSRTLAASVDELVVLVRNQAGGSWFFLGELLVSLALERDAPPPGPAGGTPGDATPNSGAATERAEPKTVERPRARPAAAKRPPRPLPVMPTQVAAPAPEGGATPAAAEANQSPPSGDEPAKPKKRTRRGSRGGRRHRKPSQAGAQSGNAAGSGNAPDSEQAPKAPSESA